MTLRTGESSASDVDPGAVADPVAPSGPPDTQGPSPRLPPPGAPATPRVTPGGARPATPSPGAARTRGATLRLLGPVFLALLLGGVALTLLAHTVQVDSLHSRTDRRLQSAVAELTRIDRQADDVASLTELLDVYLSTLHLQEGEGLLVFADGRLHASSLGRYPLEGLPGAGEEPWAALLNPGGTGQPLHGSFGTPLGEAHFVALPVQHGNEVGAVVKTALPARELSELADQRVLLLLGALVLAAGGTVVVGAVVRPLRRTVREMSRLATQATEGQPPATPVPAGVGGGEAAELARAVRGVLERVELAAAGQRRFVRLVSHELRDPLTVCQGHLELVRAGISEPVSTLPMVLDELGRMGRMVDDLQALGDADHQDFLLLTEIEVQTFTEELLLKAAAMADRSWVLDAVGEGVVRADRHRLTEAVLNLVHNAIKHTGLTDTVALGSRVEGARWTLWVRDTGVGAEPSPDLFLPAVRGPGSRRRYQGSGLGLAIVRLVAEAHGGTARVESAPGEGFAVTLELPTMVRDRPLAEEPGAGEP